MYNVEGGLRQAATALGGFDLETTILVLLTALLWGTAPLLERLGLTRLDTLTAVTVRSLSISLVLLVVALMSGRLPALLRVPPRAALFLALGGLFASLLGQYTYYAALRRSAEVSRIVPLVGAYPLVTLLVAAVFLGERLTALKVIGTALIVAGVFLLRF